MLKSVIYCNHGWCSRKKGNKPVLLMSGFIPPVAGINDDQYALTIQQCSRPWIEGKSWLMLSYNTSYNNMSWQSTDFRW